MPAPMSHAEIEELLCAYALDAVDLETVSGDLLAAVRCVQPAHASLWIKPKSPEVRA